MSAEKKDGKVILNVEGAKNGKQEAVRPVFPFDLEQMRSGQANNYRTSGPEYSLRPTSSSSPSADDPSPED